MSPFQNFTFGSLLVTFCAFVHFIKFIRQKLFGKTFFICRIKKYRKDQTTQKSKTFFFVFCFGYISGTRPDYFMLKTLFNLISSLVIIVKIFGAYRHHFDYHCPISVSII